MTEHNYFCWALEDGDENSFQQKKYRVFNVEVTKEEYEGITKIYHKLEFDPHENYSTRFQTAFKKMWDTLTQEQKQEYYDIPHFNWEGFTYITGVERESSNLVCDEDEKVNKIIIDESNNVDPSLWSTSKIGDENFMIESTAKPAPIYRVFVEGRSAPEVNHANYEEALEEAKRLAKKTMAKTYVVQIKSVVTPIVTFDISDR